MIIWLILTKLKKRSPVTSHVPLTWSVQFLKSQLIKKTLKETFCRVEQLGTTSRTREIISRVFCQKKFQNIDLCSRNSIFQIFPTKSTMTIPNIVTVNFRKKKSQMGFECSRLSIDNEQKTWKRWIKRTLAARALRARFSLALVQWSALHFRVRDKVHCSAQAGTYVLALSTQCKASLCCWSAIKFNQLIHPSDIKWFFTLFFAQ